MSSWMTANLLTLNSSKTEFLLIGLSKQLAKIHNSSLSTCDERSSHPQNIGIFMILRYWLEYKESRWDELGRCGVRQ